MGHTETRETAWEYPGREKKRGRPRLKYFDQIIGDMRCETFREAKQLAGDRAE